MASQSGAQSGAQSGERPVRGRFLVLEGSEGCGKSTQATLLAASVGALLTREPGGTATGERIRALLLDPELPSVDVRAEVLLLLAARAQHVAEIIEPALAAGRDVVCDRFAGSTLAYQGYGRGLDLEQLRTLSAWAARDVAPERVILLDVPPGVAARRLGRRGPADRMESEGRAFFERVGVGFRELAAQDPQRWRVVDGVGEIGEVAARVLAAAG